MHIRKSYTGGKGVICHNVPSQLLIPKCWFICVYVYQSVCVYLSLCVCVCGRLVVRRLLCPAVRHCIHRYRLSRRRVSLRHQLASSSAPQRRQMLGVQATSLDVVTVEVEVEVEVGRVSRVRVRYSVERADGRVPTWLVRSCRVDSDTWRVVSTTDNYIARGEFLTC